MRFPFTTRQALAQGISASALTRQVQRREIQRVCQGAYVEGSNPVIAEEYAAAVTIVSGGFAVGSFAAHLHGFDIQRIEKPFATVGKGRKSIRKGVHSRQLPSSSLVTVNGLLCTSATQTVLDMAELVEDDVWEWVLESALRSRKVSIREIEAASTNRGLGASRMRRVLTRRGSPVVPTDSLLETRMVQLVRRSEILPTPERQIIAFSKWGTPIGRVDLLWRQANLFVELDGSHQGGQLQHDVTRENAISAETGWRAVRLTWANVVNSPSVTLGRLEEIYKSALGQVPA